MKSSLRLCKLRGRIMPNARDTRFAALIGVQALYSATFTTPSHPFAGIIRADGRARKHTSPPIDNIQSARLLEHSKEIQTEPNPKVI